MHGFVAEDAGRGLGQVAVAEQRYRAQVSADGTLLQLAANFSTSACDFSCSTGKSYLALATAGLPPSFTTVLASTSACSLWWPWKVTARSSAGFCSSLLSAPSW